jgi:hypothetical protein
MTRFSKTSVLLLIAAAMLTVSTYAARPAVNKWPGSKAGQFTPKVKDMPAVLAKNLATFDDLDFRVYTHQQWQHLHHSHAENVTVHWPDGRTTQGLRKHIEDLKYMWTFAPDNRIQEHPIRFGTADGEWTVVMGWLEGTFTKPMVLTGGKVIQPTGKAYRIPMATIGHWDNHGVMSEEFLFWDNDEFMRQIGVGE